MNASVLARSLAYRLDIDLDEAELVAAHCIAELGPDATVGQALALLVDEDLEAEES